MVNKDSNYDEKFWDEVEKECWNDGGYVQSRTKKTGFEVATGQKFAISQNNNVPVDVTLKCVQKDKYVGCTVTLEAV